MRHLRVILYDEETKSILEHDSIPDGEIELSGINDALFVDVFLKVDELMLGSSTYKVISRRFSFDGVKLIISVRLKT
jgi:hypothetical protein